MILFYFVDELIGYSDKYASEYVVYQIFFENNGVRTHTFLAERLIISSLLNEFK